MKHRVTELEGALLDAAVALAGGIAGFIAHEAKPRRPAMIVMRARRAGKATEVRARLRAYVASKLGEEVELP